MNEALYSLDEIAEAFKYVNNTRLSPDAKAMLTMDIGYEKAQRDIKAMLWESINNHPEDESKSNCFCLAFEVACDMIDGTF